jgi:hypothetical protein
VCHYEEGGRLPFVSRRARLKLSETEIEMLTVLSQSRSEPAGRVQRASILLRYQAGDTVSEIARALATNRPRVERCVSKALDLGVTQALADLRIPTKSNAVPEGSRTAFRGGAEQPSERSDASSSIVGEVFGFVKKNHPERSGGGALLARKGVRGKGRQALAPPHHTATPGEFQLAGC